MTRVFHWRSWSVFLLVLGLGRVLAAEQYEGVAYVRGTERVVYRETDWLFERDGTAQRLVLYRCPDGKPFARKIVHYAPSAAAPDFDFLDARDGYREGVRTEKGVRQIFVQENAHTPLKTRALPDNADAVLDAGFDTFVRTHWADLMAGRSPRIPFLIPSRFAFLNFEISAVGGRENGRDERRLKMKLASWYGFALPAIELVYDADGRRLQEFYGVGTIRDASGRNQDVRIVFPSSDIHDDIPASAIDHAAAEPLLSRCVR